MTRGGVAARVREDKVRRPGLYCPSCLWMTGGGPCPRHGGPAWTPARQAEADAKARGERTCDCGAPLDLSSPVSMCRPCLDSCRPTGGAP